MAAKYTPAQITEKFLIVNQRIANDEPLREVLKDMQISSNTWGDWCRLSAEHELQYVRATDDRAELIFEEIKKIADDSSQDLIATDVARRAIWLKFNAIDCVLKHESGY